MNRRRLILCLASVVALPGVALAEDKPHRLVLQISDADPSKMREVLDVAANVSRYYSGMGQDVEVVVISFGAGIDMVLTGRSPVEERMSNFIKGMPNVSFKACGNTLNTLERKEGRMPKLMEDVDIVPTGVAAIMEYAEKGWTIVRP